MSRADVIDVFCPACDCNVGLAGCYEHNIGAQLEVFAIIPEGERPTTHEPEDDDVLLAVEGGRLRICLSWDRGPTGDGFSAYVYAVDLGRWAIIGGSHSGLGFGNIGDAVLHVAEE